MDKLMEILKQIRPDVDFANEKALIDDGLLDSFDVVNIVSELTEAFHVKITMTHLAPENFNSVDKMWALIQKLKSGF